MNDRFVCATSTETLHRELLRSYTTREVSESDYDCYLWEAARATTAAPLFFEPVVLRSSGVTLVDGAMRFNNPIYEVLNEAEQLYPGASFDCIVSLGTGWTGVKPLEDSQLKGLAVLQTCVDLAINAHNEAEKFAGDKRGEELLHSRRYFRFDVDHGIDTVTLEEWTKLPKIRAYTARYLARTDEKRNLEDCARRLGGLGLEQTDR
jgi:predicted acylesterase/phospholipase RssA